LRLDPAGGKKLDGGLSLAESYDLCRRVQKAHSRTYYFSTRLFPAEVRPHVHALYAFMRYADEIVDTPHDLPPCAQLSVLEEFEAETMAAVSGERVLNPILRAYADTVRACGIDPGTITAFMESMKMDTRVFRYPTYSDLEIYTYGSAAVVGLMMCRIVGVVDGKADPHA
jgi:15-cis-phytoene synthase